MDTITKLLRELSAEFGDVKITAGNKVIKITLEDGDTDQSQSTPADTSVPTHTTLVTGLWNMGRGEISDAFKRSYQQYKEKFAELLKTPLPMFIHVAAEDEDFVWQYRSRDNTQIKILSKEHFETWFPFFEAVQKIRTNTEWYSQAGWLTESPQAKLPHYNPIVMSKMFLLNDAAASNPFNSEYLFWIDAGITNTIHSGYFWHDRVFDNLPKYMEAIDSILMISYPYEGAEEIHGFPRAPLARYCKTDYVKYVCRGGFFGGKKDHIHDMNGLYYNILSSTLSDGLMGTEESIFTILSHKYPSKFHRFEIAQNGLISPFFEAMKDVDTAIRRNVPKTLTYKTSTIALYVLGFNSPSQFEDLCKSLELADKNLVVRTKRYLINNSTDRTTFAEYDTLCERYGFTEIHKDNIGICGGRQFVAEHFEQSDADFYLFFEDDMQLNPPDITTPTCKMGMRTFIPNFLYNITSIALKEKLDFLKISFSEFFGDNSVQWAWYNVPQAVRTEVWPHNDRLPETGLDPNAPLTQFNHIKAFNKVSYALGNVYYSNWPQLVSRDGNKKMFLDTKWDHPYEQTWMSYIFQESRAGNIKGAILLASPVTHDRVHHYSATERREN
jgi:hypothetical protein